MGTYSNSGIDTYMHKVYSGLRSPIKVSFKMFIYCQYGQAIRLKSGFVYMIETQDIFQGKDDIGRLA